jgi:hypothetical protein
MPFAWVEYCPKLTEADALPKFRSLVASAAKGMQDENQRVMTVLSTTAREQDALVLAVDHFGKDVSTGTRNSSVKEAHVDAVLALLGERVEGLRSRTPGNNFRREKFSPSCDSPPSFRLIHHHC